MADTFYWCDSGISNSLDRLVTSAGGNQIGGQTLRLFKNNPSPAPSKATVIGDLTQCDFPGYSGQSLSTSNWPSSTVTSHVAKSTYNTNVTFTRSSTGTPQTVYGAYITDSMNSILYGVCLFAGGPVTLTNSGEFVAVSPSLTLESKN